jgi:hypothetical protein
MPRLVGVLVEAVQTVASCEHEQIHIDFAKRVLFVAGSKQRETGPRG